VIGFEDGECLRFVGACVVAAFGGLDGVAAGGGRATRGCWVGSVGIGRRREEGGGCEGQGEGEREEGGEEHGCGFCR
jgi:hypothetical protein